jgi:hypothetical protein
MSFNINEHKEVAEVTMHQDISLDIMKWGQSNAYPNTFENLIKQSPNAKPTINRAAKFLKGDGFEGEDIIINSSGMTLKQLVAEISYQQAAFGGHAIGVNYNLEGKVAEIIPYRVKDLRFRSFDDNNLYNKVGYYNDFAGISEIRKTTTKPPTKHDIDWIDIFNPNQAPSQWNSLENGISDYKGQILYYSNSGSSRYPEPNLQSQINYVLADIENSILMRKQSSTGFINTSLITTSLDSEDNSLYNIQQDIEDSQGARGSGSVVVISGVSEDTLFEVSNLGDGGSSQKNTIDNIEKSLDLVKKQIFGSYLIPPILAGVDQNNGFSGVDLEDAYKVFNAVTREERGVIESSINRILAVSNFDVKKIKIKELKLNIEGESDEKVYSDEPVAEAEFSGNALGARELNKIISTNNKYKSGKMTKKQAYLHIKSITNWSDEHIESFMEDEE